MTSAKGTEKGATVRLDKVSFSYGETSLPFDVEFAASKITAIMGPSGSGNRRCSIWSPASRRRSPAAC